MTVDSKSLPPEIERLAAEAAKDDSFGPPPENCLCACLHCNREFMSDEMWFQVTIKDGKLLHGFWMCPTHNCGGAGFQFDIFPVDPNHPANEGWHYSDSDDEGEWNDDDDVTDTPKQYDPAEPEFAALEADEDLDEDLEGEEWKHGLQPGELPQESPASAEARRQWEEEQKQYDLPDERPRWIDRTGEPDPPERAPGVDEDIPF